MLYLLFQFLADDSGSFPPGKMRAPRRRTARFDGHFLALRRHLAPSQLPPLLHLAQHPRLPLRRLDYRALALWIYHRASQSERSYSGEASTINMVRELTWRVWSGRANCEEAGVPATMGRALREFVGERRSGTSGGSGRRLAARRSWRRLSVRSRRGRRSFGRRRKVSSLIWKGLFLPFAS